VAAIIERLWEDGVNNQEEGLVMRSRSLTAALLVSAPLLAGGCATSEEWADWYSHPTHWASGQHFLFSSRNRQGAAPRVTRRDLDASRAEKWWGRVITVSPDQVFQN
jgi:hypothetical protein